MARIFVGIAWPYANGPFHIGQLAGAFLPGDIFARYHRLRGSEVLMVSGSDMHGTPALVTAEREGVSPAVVTERFHAVNKRSFERLGFTFDLYTHTHTPTHERTVQETFLALLEHGFVRRRTEEGAFCPKHARFLPDRYLLGTCPHCGFENARGDECDRCGRPVEPRLLGNARCSLCGTPAEFRPSEHFYLELDQLQTRLAEYVAAQGHWRAPTRHVAENFLAEGLHPTPITRDLDWGVPIPLEGYATKRFYVWFDAVIGYLSASKEWAANAGRPDAWRRFWDEGESVRSYYFIGKDNRFFHTIIWPGILLGTTGLQLPYDVPANEWLLVGGGKVSKSRTADAQAFLPALLDRYPPDVIRFYAALLAPQNRDTELDWTEFDQLWEDWLANQYGNLVQRTLVLARERYGGKIPAPPPGWVPDDSAGVGERLRAAHARIGAEYEAVHLKEALDLALAEVREANRRFHDAKPWDTEEPERARVVYETLWRLKAIALWLAPVIPFSSAEVFRMLGYSGVPPDGHWGDALVPPHPGQPLGEIRPLFPKSPRAAAATPSPPTPTTADPASVPLAGRAGVVRSVAVHPSADKLYVLEIDVGEASPRTVVAGLRPSYAPEELTGRGVVLLSNLAPRTIRRMTSQGMVLAAEAGDRSSILVPPDGTAPGTYLAGAGSADRTISYEEFASVPLHIGRVVGPDLSGGSEIDLGDRRVSAPGAWPAGTLCVVRRPGPTSDRGEVVAFGPGLAVRPLADVPPGAKVR
ncbi:MAG TPA: methionine--tRNA ligase [Thermoplasmata archaeon]|nr:methionine--tRNA ligase [Thermoplasmata archaeon]